MKFFAINEARKPPRIGSIVIMSGTLLCAVATSGPAFSADLPDDYGRPRYTEYDRPDYDRPRYDRPSYDRPSYDRPRYDRPRYDRYDRPSYDRPSYDRSSYDRDCCCCSRRYATVAERPMVERAPPRLEEESRQVIERVPFAERHWVQRDYIERRYPAPGPRYSSPNTTRYSYYYPRPSAEAPYYRDEARSEPPPRYSGEYPPSPAAYEYDAPPPRYAAPPRLRELRPAYEYEPSPRPPASIRSGYYYPPGYTE